MDLKKAKELCRNVTHIGFIMDGNRRWAVANNLPKIKGHNHGVDALKKILKLQRELDVKTFTFYTLSRDNKKKRGEEEYNNLMNLAIEQFDKLEELANKDDKKTRIRILGEYRELREDVSRKLKEIEKRTREYGPYNINFLINYDGQHEIIQGIRMMLAENRELEDVDEKTFKKYLYTAPFEPPQIIIRTGDMPRLSGFLLWDSQYSEIFFSEKMWPAFNEDDLYEILEKFNKVDRKFGK
jgi:undecaprenyl diphosphate synthase